MSALQPFDSPQREQPRQDRHTAQHEIVHSHSNSALRSPPCRPLGRAKRVVFVVLAAMFLGVAALGAILPGLPCTPFVLLTSYFLLRSWPQMNDRLLRSRLFGPLLRDWQERGGVARQVKVKAIALVAVVVGATLYFGSLSPIFLGVVSIASLVGILVIARLPETRGH